MFLLAACQTATATPATPVATAKAATSQPTKAGPTAAAATPTATGATVHSSSTDPNAPNLIVVKDQAIVNNSLTFTTITAAKPCFIVLYYDRERKGKQSFGGIISFTAVPAGKTSGFVFSLNPNLNASVNLQSLGNLTVDAVLQSDASDPNKMIHNGGSTVWVSFMILPSKQGKPGLFPTPTP